MCILFFQIFFSIETKMWEILILITLHIYFVIFRSVNWCHNCCKIAKIEMVILWVYYTIPVGFSLFWHVWDISFQLLKLLLWLRTTDEGSVPEMRIWSILLIKSDLKWCIHLSRSLFLYLRWQSSWSIRSVRMTTILTLTGSSTDIWL